MTISFNIATSVDDSSRPLAYSYVRFSTKRQAGGDSQQRQIERSRQYAAEHNLDLQELSYEDLGVSACWTRLTPQDLGGTSGKGQTKRVKFEAGKTYYAYASGNTWVTKQTPGGFVESSGSCTIEYFSEKNPFYNL